MIWILAKLKISSYAGKNMKAIAVIFLILLSIITIIGCGEDIPILLETLNVTDLKAREQTVGVEDTTTIEATVVYTGDTTVLMYTWSATGGAIRGTGNSVTYQAPTTPGVYSISVKVTDGAVSSGKTIEVRVAQSSSTVSLILDQDTHFPSENVKDKLVYDVNIAKLSGEKLMLHFEITQDKDQFDAFLSIEIDGKLILPEMAIGNEVPSTGKVTVRDINVSSAIKAPGRYLITFYIRPGNRVQNGWLLNEAKLIGAEGSSDPQQ
jgi:hypothetical protein